MKFKDISRISMKLKDIKDFSKYVATLAYVKFEFSAYYGVRLTNVDLVIHKLSSIG